MTHVYPHIRSFSDGQLLSMYRQLKLVMEGDGLPIDTAEDGYKEVQAEMERRNLDQEE